MQKTLNQIKAMFAVGQKWDAVNTWTHANGPLELVEKRATQLICKTEKHPRYFVYFPQASQIIEARDGYLSFRIFKPADLDAVLKYNHPPEYLDRMRSGTLTLTRQEV